MYDIVFPRISEVYLIIFLIFFAIIVIFFAVSFFREKTRKQEALVHHRTYQKEKKIGLTNIEVKIFDWLLKELKLKKASELTGNPSLFEKGLQNFFSNLNSPAMMKNLNLAGNSPENLSGIITQLYTKIYSPGDLALPLENIRNIEKNTFLCMVVDERHFLTGRLEGTKDNNFIIHLFHEPHSFRELANKEILVVLSRKGDSIYSFYTKVIYIENRIIFLHFPDVFKRGNETIFPIAELSIPCLISHALTSEGEEKKFFLGIIKEFRSSQVMIHSGEVLLVGTDFLIKVEIDDCTIHLKAKLITEKTRKQDDTFSYTFDLIEVSELALTVIKKYVTNHAA